MGRPLPSGLESALDETQVEQAIAAALEPRLGSTLRVRRVKSSILKRRVLRYEVELEGPFPVAPLCLIGKVYESCSAGERGLHALSWLCEQGFPSRAPACVTVPRPVAFLPDLSLLLMEEAHGRSLQGMLKDGSARPEHLRLFALALLELHGLPAVFGSPFTLDDHLAVRCAGLVEPLRRAFPELVRPVARILESARRAEQGALAPASTVAHGDYHPGQVHLDGQRVWLVDLDPLHQGNPGYDVAMALFSLARLEAGGEDRSRVAALRESFLGTYFARSEARLAARIPLDVALIYLKRACKRFRWQDEAGWQDAVRRQVAQAERCIDWLEAAHPCDSVADVLALGEHCPVP